MSETPDEESGQAVSDNHAVPLSLIIRAMVVGFTFAIVIPIVLVLYLNHQDTQRRLEQNKELVQRNEQLTRHLNNERIERLRAVNRFIFDQCKRAEQRDTVIVRQNKALLAILSRVPAAQHTLYIDRLVQSLQDTNYILEPPNEPSCVPPSSVKP